MDKAPFKAFLELYAELLFVALYPAFLVLGIVSLQLGVLGWIVLALSLTPPTALWYFLMKKRLENYLKLLMAKPRPWDVKKAVEEYFELQKRQKSRKKGKAV